jgi:hypothetical protein
LPLKPRTSSHQIQLLNDDVLAEEFELRKHSKISDDTDINLKDLRLSDFLSNPQGAKRGRIMSEKADLLLFSTWIDRCAREHGTTCHVQSSDRAELARVGNFHHPSNLGADFRVIEIQAMKLHPASTNCKYITLSYQWGNTSRLVGLKSNVHLLSENGGIIEEDLPLTVRDAIRFAAIWAGNTFGLMLSASFKMMKRARLSRYRVCKPSSCMQT